MNYIGEIVLFGGNFPPNGWAFCDGQLLAISENDALFQLIGTTYGGDGQTTFALPDLRGRVPVHMSFGYVLGQNGGAETISLSINQMPGHAHVYTYQPVASSSGGTQTSPANAFYAGSGRKALYADKSAIDGEMADIALAQSVQTGPAGGGSAPFSVMQPYQVVSYIISLFGVFPSQS